MDECPSTAKQAHHGYLLPSIIDLMPAKSSLEILDAGCGNGYVAWRLACMGHSVTAVDTSDSNVAIGRRAFTNVSFSVRSVYDDISDLAPDGGWDLVVSSEVIEHLYSPQRFLKNMWSLLAEGGGIILTTPYHGYLKNLVIGFLNKWDKHWTVDWEGGHIKFFSQSTLAQMLMENGFSKPVFRNAGRCPFIWKSMVCFSRKVL